MELLSQIDVLGRAISKILENVIKNFRICSPPRHIMCIAYHQKYVYALGTLSSVTYSAGKKSCNNVKFHINQCFYGVRLSVSVLDPYICIDMYVKTM